MSARSATQGASPVPIVATIPSCATGYSYGMCSPSRTLRTKAEITAEADRPVSQGVGLLQRHTRWRRVSCTDARIGCAHGRCGDHEQHGSC
eukprot:scaffold9374_cov63-Phaeocystis_antarctica.AAC.4